MYSKIQNIDKEELLSRQAPTNDRNLMTIGPLFVELLSAAFWSNSLLFYQATLKLVSIHLERGAMPQVALAYVHLGSVAGGRFQMIRFASEMGAIAQRLIEKFPDDSYTVGRTQSLHPLFLGHFEKPIRHLIPNLEGALESTLTVGRHPSYGVYTLADFS